MSETPAETAELSVADRLARFLLAESTEAAKRHGLTVVDGLDAPFEAVPETVQQAQLDVAERVLGDFLRIDVEANSIYAMPGVDAETLMPFGMVHWGPMAGRLKPDELRAIGAAFIEIAEAADLDSIMVRWLLRDPGADKQAAIRVLAAFRGFRAEMQAEA